MNYAKIYKSIIEKSKSERRSKGGEIYYESHHIIPDFMFANRKRKGPKGHLRGNPDDPKNLVLLTPREHILCHVLLAKALKGKRYWAQAASSISWFYTKVIGKHSRQNKDLPGLMRKYEAYRKMGLTGISEARRGKFPAVDAITGESVGSVDRNHPKVVSGEWKHHSKGRKVTDQEEIKRRKQASNGRKNGNARVIDLDYIKSKMIEYDKIVKSEYGNNFIKKKFIEWFDNQTHVVVFYRFENTDKMLEQKIFGVSSDFLDIANLAKSLIPTTGWNVPLYGMGAKYNKQERWNWYTNGVDNKQVKLTDVAPDGYYKGRTAC